MSKFSPDSGLSLESFKLAELDAHGLEPCHAAREYLRKAFALIQKKFDPLIDVTLHLRLLSDAVDNVLMYLWKINLEDFPQIALLAVGGYGRGELFPQSDIDILILLERKPDAALISALESFVTSLWDSGLNIGHSVRTLKECEALAREDLTVVTNMMESRHLLGDPSLEGELHKLTATENMWPPKEFIRGKLKEQQKRHDKFSNTEYALEPNVKSSPGGLRDLQVIEWIMLRCFGLTLEKIDQRNFLNETEVNQLRSGKKFLNQVRFALHSLTGRAEDRLLFDHQKQLAALWGFSDGDRLAVEKYMQVYYRWMQALSQLNELIIELFEHSPNENVEEETRTIDSEFEVKSGRICARHDQVFKTNSGNLLRIFVLIGNDPLVDRIAPNTQRLLRRDAHLIDTEFRASPENRNLFLQLLSVPHNMTKQLRRMSRHGVLGLYLPAFGKIIGQMQFDLFHAYTVDAHSLEVIANTRRFMRADYTDKFPVSTRIARRLRNPLLLYISALFHDIGKGRGGDHSELGAIDAKIFCSDHNLGKTDTDLIVWLVRNHLLMSQIAQRRDISDPDEIQKFAKIVGTEERLDYLYTLTVADIAGTNPDLWNAWRSSLMRQLYTETRRALTRGLTNPVGRKELVDAAKQSATEILEYRGFLARELTTIWATRGEDYFLRERPEDIAWHTEAISDHYSDQDALVLVKQATASPIANATQIFVHSKRQQNTFARICTELETLDFSIHDARIYSDTEGETLDTFFVLRSDGSPLDNHPDTFLEIKKAIELSLKQPVLRQISKHTPRTIKAFQIPTEIRIFHELADNLITLEIITADRPGLLARIGQILCGFNITVQGAKIQTLGERVEDIFFLSDELGNGAPLSIQLTEKLELELHRQLHNNLEKTGGDST